jgi:hypothetical protein
MQCVVCSRILRCNHFSFYFTLLSSKFIKIPTATRGVSPTEERKRGRGTTFCETTQENEYIHSICYHLEHVPCVFETIFPEHCRSNPELYYCFSFKSCKFWSVIYVNHSYLLFTYTSRQTYIATNIKPYPILSFLFLPPILEFVVPPPPETRTRPSRLLSCSHPAPLRPSCREEHDAEA